MAVSAPKRSGVQFSLADFERYRDYHFRRTPDRRIASEKSALSFINEVGFCAAFTAGMGLPCLREAIAGEREPLIPEHIQHDYAIGMVWRLKDTFAHKKLAYYGKVFGGRPGFISLSLLPAFLRLRIPSGGYRAMYRRGELGHCAKLVMDQLTRRGPCETMALKLASGYSAPGKRSQFDGAMRHLQECFLALKIEERSDPFTYVWDTIEHRWSEHLKAARTMRPADAARTLVRAYFLSCGFGNESRVARLLGISAQTMEKVCVQLEQSGELIRSARITGLPGTCSLIGIG